MGKNIDNPKGKERQLNINANSPSILEMAEYFNEVEAAQSPEKKTKHKPKAR